MIVRLSDSLVRAEAGADEQAALSRISEYEIRRFLVEHAVRIEEADPDEMHAVFGELLSRVESNGDVLRAHSRIGCPVKEAPNMRIKWGVPMAIRTPVATVNG